MSRLSAMAVLMAFAFLAVGCCCPRVSFCDRGYDPCSSRCSDATVPGDLGPIPMEPY